MFRKLDEADRELIGAKLKNPSIVDRIRKDGYIGVMFNKADFMDGVVWASNFTNSFKEIMGRYKDRSVVPIEDLPLRKDDLFNAYMLMMKYYTMKNNLRLVEECKLGLYSVSKFQHMPLEDKGLLERWDAYMQSSQRRMEAGDYGAEELGDLEGTEAIYQRYQQKVTEEVNKYKEAAKTI